MGVFKMSQFFPVSLPNLDPVAEDVEQQFRGQGFEVSREPTVVGGWHIDIGKGGMFKAVLGLKTALKVEMEPSRGGTMVKAGVGIFGSQAVPTMITLFIAWPVLITQIWGLVQQASLDKEVMRVVEHSLAAHATGAAPAVLGVTTPGGRFCTGCGHALVGPAKFCPECGAKVA